MRLRIDVKRGSSGARRPRYGRLTLSRWQGWLAAAVVTLVACVLVVLDVTDAGLRGWWDGHALTTDTLAGLLVLMITALIVDQAFRLKQGGKRAAPSRYRSSSS